MATSAGFPPGALTFLRGIKANNDRAWFEAHRERYERDLIEPAKDFVLDLQAQLKKISPRVRADPRVNGSIGRLNRDLRFTKDKRPYKDHLTLWLWEGASKHTEAGYYLQLRPPTLGIGAGAYHFEGKTLDRYRAAVAHPTRGAKLARIVAALRRSGYEVGGSSLKRVPAPYPKDHPRAELLKHQGLYAWIEIPVGAKTIGRGLAERCAAHARKMAPLEEWLLSL